MVTYISIISSRAGITGVLLVLVLMVMYIFASQTARRYMHTTFWIVHKLFIVLYGLMIIHGLMWLTQKPNFYCYFVGPITLFIADKILSVTRRKMKLNIVSADLLPSSKSISHQLTSLYANYFGSNSLWLDFK